MTTTTTTTRRVPRRRLHGAVLAHYTVLRDYGWPPRAAARRARRAHSLPLHLSQRPYPAGATQ